MAVVINNMQLCPSFQLKTYKYSNTYAYQGTYPCIKMDITYISIRCCFLQPVGIMDWHNRGALFWCVANTLNADVAEAVLNEQ